MSFKFAHRPYSGKQFRPLPEVYQDDQLLIVVTPWGSRESSQKVIQAITDFIEKCRLDLEATAIYPRLSCLNTHANNLRIAVMTANKAIYETENQQEFIAGFELFVLYKVHNEAHCLQIGMPSAVLSQMHSYQNICLLAGSDHSSDIGRTEQPMSSLASELLGLENSIHPLIKSFKIQSGDKIILASHSKLPSSVYSKTYSEMDLELLCRDFALQQPDTAFWLGILEL